MKSKPVKHKSTNTFKFVSFAERINLIDIRHAALYHIEHAYTEQPEENETHFHIALRKWYALNLTDNFKKFRKDVSGIITVPQLIHKKEYVLGTLEKYLLLEDQLCLQPLLEILVSLAKDLREDFYAEFPKFLDILINLLDTKNGDRLEWTLICLAFLFKILKPYLKKDIHVVLKRIIPLLSEKKPQFINNFAAESFAFVARDIRDKKKFILLLLNYLQTHNDAIAGCGHLLFEILKGVSGKFHSCVETYLPIILQTLKENTEYQSLLFQVLTQTFTDSLQCMIPQEFTLFWNCVLKYIEEILSDNEDNKGLEYILRLAGQVVEHHNGKYLTNPPEFILLLIKIICEQSKEEVLSVCAQIGALLLLSSYVSLSQEHAGLMVKVVLTLPYPNILISFVQNVIEYSQFELQILPQFLNFVIHSKFDTEAVYTLTKICIAKSPLCKSGIKLFDWVKYPLNFGSGLPHFMTYFNDCVNIDDVNEIINEPTKCIQALICLPHVEKFDVDNCIQVLSKFIKNLTVKLSTYNIESQAGYNSLHTAATPTSSIIRQILFLLGLAIETAIHVSGCKRLKEISDIEQLLPILLPCAADPNYVSALQIVDLFLTAYEIENGLSYGLLLLVDSYLKDNIRSPFHTVRLLTTHTYKLFENVPQLKKSLDVGNSTEVFSVFSLCYSIECIKPSIQEYRTQLNLLQKLSFNTTQYNILKSTEFQHFSLNFMLGILYSNFKLLWEPVIEYIYGFGNALNPEDFWPTFHKALEMSFINAKMGFKKMTFDNEMETNYELLNKIYSDYNNIPEKPDLCNYRILMLKIMTQCISVCEAKNRDVVTIFLNFIDNEYRRNDNANALKTDVEIHDKMQLDNVNEESEEAEMQDESETVNGKVSFKTLINVMQVLSQFKNPRALHKEPIFWELYMEFLKNKNPGLQKYALDCVLNYKDKHLLPYKSNLYNIVDENKLKDELIAFKITEDSESLRPEDREHVVPIILRILYGKMTTKLGPDKKGGGQTRRALVMRYLAGCAENELRMFIEMAFSHFKHYMHMNPKVIYEEVVSNLDLKSIMSPGKLHSVLNLFEVVREYFGGYIKGDLLMQFCNIFYAIISTIAAVLAQSDKVHVGYLKVMKYLRTIAISTLRKIFEQFEKQWDKDELYVVFETVMWPLLPKLHFEGVNSPTILLKLLHTWCQNPRFYVLLITCTDDESLSPVSEIFNLLQCGKAHAVVVNMILDMVENLLTLTEEGEENAPAVTIETFKSLPVKDSEKTSNINFGSKILIPFIPNILDIMKRRLTNSVKNPSVNARDLLILSRITELVAIPELCDELLYLLLPILVKKVCMNMAEENMEYAINTIFNLLNHSANPQKYIKNIAVLFNKVAPVDVRKLLCKLIASIAENSVNNKENLMKLSNVVNEMNAFNKRWLEQPDFDRRLDAYKSIYELSENDNIDADLAILIVNNCFYFIKTEKDIGLRDSAGLCLRRILPKLLLKYKATNEGQFLIRDTVLSLISSGIRDTKNDLLRNECLGLLGELVRECPDTDVIFSDLAPLTNKEDTEVDYFENMCHLQMHRRVRALLKFIKTFKKVIKSPAPKTLTNFIMPMASMYLLDNNYSDKNTLIDAAIDTISMCCRLLPWYHYEVILKYYLNKLRQQSDHQKQLTRILIGILDAFHYDFSKAQNVELPKSLVGNIKNYKQGVSKNVGNKENDVDNEEKTDKMDVDEHNNDDKNPENNENDQKKQSNDPDLESQLKAADDEVEEEVPKEVQTAPAYERISSVSPSVAKRIIKSLALGLLPHLNRAIGKMSEHEGSHQVNRRRVSLERQEEDMLRVPLALALVKLLQRLPAEILNHHLTGIIIKLCSFLKSPLKRVRITARDIVKKVMITVGTAYLGLLLEHLKLLLTRGFQVHVLVSTIHTVLDALKTDFKKGELDKNLKYILEVCANDLFGALSEEKEVDKLHYKTPEAKPNKKSYVTLMIAAQNITENALIDLILPFKEILQNHHSKKTVLNVQEALTHISTGLVSNAFIDIERLFVFLHGIASESIPELILGVPKREISEKQREVMLRARPDCFIIQAAPKRNREMQSKNVRTSSKANAHVLVEFSLNILYVLLKREKLPKNDSKAFVDPIVPLLVDSLRSDHVRVTTLALNCITSLWTIKIVTNTLEENINDIVKAIFLILHKYATFEITKQNDNYHLVRSAFKAVTVLTRSVKYYTMQADQLKTLLLYAEEDCQNTDRQSNSFALLKAILEAKLVSTELHEVMDKVSQICILSESAKSREEARLIFLKYLSSYSLGKRLKRHIEFFVSQLNYELQHGRESSLKFLELIISKIKKTQLLPHSGFLLVSLGTTMVNDASSECRQFAALCIEALLRKLKGEHRNNLFQIVLTFFNDNKLIHLELAAQLCTRFVNVEKTHFQNRLNVILPIINDKLLTFTNDGIVGRFVKLQSEEVAHEPDSQERDHCLIQLLNLTEKISIHCSASMNNKKFVNEFDDIGQQCQALLAYPHAWVRLRCAKIFNQILLRIDVNHLDSVLRNTIECERGFLYYDTENTLRSLILDLCAQYTPGIGKDMADEITAVLYQIIKLMHSLHSFKVTVKNIAITDYEQMEHSKLNIRWIIFKLRKAISAEVAKTPSTSNIRIAIFTMWIHLINLFEVEDMMKVVDIILAPVVRELSTGDAMAPASPAKQLAGRIGKKLRRKLGDIEYSKLAAVAQTRLNVRRAERKKEINQEKVKDPLKAAKRKEHIKEKKRLIKKMKLDTHKGKRPKKRKAQDIDLEDALLE